MSYEEKVGFGLIPGAGQGPESTFRLANLFRIAGYDSVAVDLPIENRKYKVRDYGKIAAERFQDLGRAIIIGHSMGGRVAPFAAQELIDYSDTQVDGIVLINSVIPCPQNICPTSESAPPKYMPGYIENAIDDSTYEGYRVFKPAARDYLMQECNDEDAEYLLRHFRKQSVNVDEQPIEAWPEVRTLLLIGRQEKAVNPERMKYDAQVAGIPYEELWGDHFMHISKTPGVGIAIVRHFKWSLVGPNLDNNAAGS